MAFGQQPFKQAIAMQNKISEIIAKGGGDLIVQMAIQALGEYKSRGHGKGKLGKVYHVRSKYMPHQGKREKQRRVQGGFYGTAR